MTGLKESMNSDSPETSHMSSELRQALSENWSGVIHWDVAMADYCTFQVGGKADALLVVSNLEELESLMCWLGKNRVSWRVIGRGSNILVKSKGFGGVVIVLGGDFCTIDHSDDTSKSKKEIKLRIGAGCSVARLVDWCCRNGISGVEFLVGIPGSVGGAVRMNAGAWGSEIGNCIQSVSYIGRDGKVYEASGNDLEFSYRQLRLREDKSDDVIIIETVLCLTKGNQRKIITLCREYLGSRRAKQPLGVASAGSFFKNPPGDFAGRLIEDAGLKGLRMGNAMVSTKHANFIVNTGQATADDIVALMEEVQQKVYIHSGIMLEPEVQIL